MSFPKKNVSDFTGAIFACEATISTDDVEDLSS